jgi:hypothetical protein
LFDPAVHGPVGVRGDSANTAGTLSWNVNNVLLTRETVGVANASFWSGVGYFPKALINAGQQIQYKFYIENTAFGGRESNISNRVFAFPQSDTTLAWQFFNSKILPTSVEDNTYVPMEVQLYQNYPNPFNPSTKIRFDLAKSSHVTIIIYNLLGQNVVTLVDERRPAGSYSVDWNTRGISIPSGVYFARLTTGSTILLRKILVLK